MIVWVEFADRKVGLIHWIRIQGILAEILEFVMGTGLIPADGEVWKRRRRAIVPSLHKKVHTVSPQSYEQKIFCALNGYASKIFDFDQFP